MLLLLGICSSIYYLVGTSGGGRKNIEVPVLEILHVRQLFTGVLLYAIRGSNGELSWTNITYHLFIFCLILRSPFVLPFFSLFHWKSEVSHAIMIHFPFNVFLVLKLRDEPKIFVFIHFLVNKYVLWSTVFIPQKGEIKRPFPLKLLMMPLVLISIKQTLLWWRGAELLYHFCKWKPDGSIVSFSLSEQWHKKWTWSSKGRTQPLYQNSGILSIVCWRSCVKLDKMSSRKMLLDTAVLQFTELTDMFLNPDRKKIWWKGSEPWGRDTWLLSWQL